MSDHNELDQPNQIRTVAYAQMNQSKFDEYIRCRLEGFSRMASLRVSFGEDYMQGNTPAYIWAIEANHYYKKKYEFELKKIDIKKLWNPQVATIELLQIVRDPMNKETARLGAIKELNVLAEITLTDDNGKSKVGRSLDDFYRQHEGAARDEERPARGEEPAAPEPTPNGSQTTH